MRDGFEPPNWTSLQLIQTRHVFQIHFGLVLDLLQGTEEISQPGQPD